MLLWCCETGQPELLLTWEENKQKIDQKKKKKDEFTISRYITALLLRINLWNMIEKVDKFPLTKKHTES